NHGDSVSINTQGDLARQYCTHHEITIWAFYTDEGVSGMSCFEQRPAGARLLQDARAGQFDLVLVHRVDRLGRALNPIRALRRDLAALGIEMQSLTEQFDLGSQLGDLLNPIWGTRMAGLSGYSLKG
ncbi:MAG: recombinase family protein, partial [Chloroflexi bacterium]|nr:recombinase family protein [Chloroflexota bacterium]